MKKTVRKLLFAHTDIWTVQLFRYFFVGGIAFLFSLITLLVLTEVFNIHYLISNAIGFLFGLLVNYVLSRAFVFGKTKAGGYSEFALFSFVGVIGLVLDTGLMFFFTQTVGLHYVISKFISTAIIFIWNFVGRKLIFLYLNNKASETALVTIKNVCIILMVVSLIFLFALAFINSPDGWRHNLGGTHSWLTGSTIKFTDAWLEDGALQSRFLMMETLDSIEMEDIIARVPYFSYPPGTIITTYTIARLLGLSSVSVGFVKGVSVIFYGLGALVISLILYFVLDLIVKVTSRLTKIILPILLAGLWILLPANVYYLRNVFFSDQMVLFWVSLLILLDLLKTYGRSRSRAVRITLDVCLVFTIFMGVLTEYYFWIVLFVIGIGHLVRLIAAREPFGKIARILSVYVLPAVTAVALFVIQLVTTFPDWYERLRQLADRRLATDIEGMDFFQDILYFINGAYGTLGLLIFTLLAATLLGMYGVRLFRKDIYLEQKEQFAGLMHMGTVLIVPTFAQIFIFMNHSGSHEFSILKLGLPFVFGFVFVTYFVLLICRANVNSGIDLKADGWGLRRLPVGLLAVWILLMSFIGVSNFGDRVSGYFAARYYIAYYEMPDLIRENTAYEHVLFSFTEEIPINPPQELAMSRKRVYPIETLDDIQAWFPNLSSDAVLVFVIGRYGEKTPEIEAAEAELFQHATLLAESGRYILLQK